MIKKLARIFLVLFCGCLLLILFACGPLIYGPEHKSIEKRFASFPSKGLPLAQNVEVYWNEFAIPFIHARTDNDAAFSLGLVHAHLRLGQMELLRHLAEGRLSELLGPFTSEIDAALRTVDLDKSSVEIANNLPAKTTDWLQNYVKGINYYVSVQKQMPVEFDVLDIKSRPWSVKDVVSLSRVAGIDISWIYYALFLRQDPGKKRDKEWQEFLLSTSNSPESFSADPEQLTDYLAHFSKSGSNSVVVSGLKSASGSGLIASDPHLGIYAPNIWLIAGIKSPGLNAVGLMIPGLPFFALGRNENIAWGGTNLRGISSHLFKVTDPKSINCLNETIKRRWWFSKNLKVCSSPYGPIISDLSSVKDSNAVALNWQGHSSNSDEISAFLKVNRAKNWEEFKEAFSTYAVSAQNMLYTDKKGSIGQVLAYRQPLLKSKNAYEKLIKSDSEFTSNYLTPVELPASYNPDQGFIASANNKPFDSPVKLAFKYSHPDRIKRLTKLVSSTDLLSIKDLKSIQSDTYSSSDKQLRDHLLGLIKNFRPQLNSAEKQALDCISSWDARYQSDSQGAACFQIFVATLIEYFTNQGTIDAASLRPKDWRKVTILELKKLAYDKQLLCLREALEAVSEKLPVKWGDMHRQKFQHPLGMLPLVGYRYRFANYPAEGSNETVNKSGHSITKESHKVSYGAQARHISDMSDPDANYFVLLGGQDGWLITENLADQISLWRRGKYIKVPLSLDRIQNTFKRVNRLSNQNDEN